MALRQRLLQIARTFLSVPTAPYREHRARAHIRAFCAERGLAVRQDPFGNLVATYGRGHRNELFAFEAHMDHPGFIVEKDSRRGQTVAQFFGGVEEPYFKGARVRVFTVDGEVRGRVTKTRFLPKQRVKRVWLELDGKAKRGDLAMWDLPPCRIRGDRLYARSCDDSVGCVAVLALIDELARRGVEKQVRCVFAAAEEFGLHGAKYLCASRRIPKRTRVVAIETSRELPGARIGDGVIIRVGDRARIFTPAMTAFMTHVARAIRKTSKRFRFQRKLMDGGTCESTVYDAHGYVNGAVCLALGNYHNRNFRRKKIAAERVSVNDLESMVELFLGMVERSEELERFLKPTPPAYREERRPLGEWLLHDA